MASTYGEIWKSLLLQCPFVPVPLAQQWVKDRYREAVNRCWWGGQVAESQFVIPDAYSTGTITTTAGSHTINGVGTGWTANLVGRQLLTGGAGPYYTVAQVTSPTVMVVDLAWGTASLTGSDYQIVQAYLTPPSDFLSFKTIKDPVNNWRLRFNISQEYLDRIDARRATTGNAWIIADYRQLSISTITSTGDPDHTAVRGAYQYEIWPRVISARQYPYLYYKRPAEPSGDSDVFIQPFQGDEIKRGALADLATWPGTETRKNPCFNLALAAKYEKDFTEFLNNLERIDQDTYLNDYISPQDGWDSLSAAPLDSKFWQVHDDY